MSESSEPGVELLRGGISLRKGNAVRFCGMELKLHPRGGILLSQESYTKDLLDRFPDVPEALVPIARTEDVEESPREPGRCQKSANFGRRTFVGKHKDEA